MAFKELIATAIWSYDYGDMAVLMGKGAAVKVVKEELFFPSPILFCGLSCDEFFGVFRARCQVSRELLHEVFKASMNFLLHF